MYLEHITFARKQEMYFYQNHAKKLIKGQIFEIGFLNIELNHSLLIYVKVIMQLKHSPIEPRSRLRKSRPRTFVLSLFYNFFFSFFFVFTRIFKKAFLNFWMGRHMGLQQAGGIGY